MVKKLPIHNNAPDNTNNNLTAIGMVETLLINLGVFLAVMLVFEINRHYKQIYLKRLQRRFQISKRVPPVPPEFMGGWFFEINKYQETDILRMVGLDAYMCLRYIGICYKLAIFLSLWGLLVLVPTYATAAVNPSWDRFAISNLLFENNGMRSRLWISAIFSYVFAAYFCQLLYAEYHNFNVRRMQYLIQEEDPDTPQQTYFTIMIERIPSHLRSASQLFKFFDKLFPGDVYTAEVAQDLNELDSRNNERKKIRDKLEKVIAKYEAKNIRDKVYINTIGKESAELSTAGGIFEGDSILQFLGKALAPEKYGYFPTDAIEFYTNRLIELNREVKVLQERYLQLAVDVDQRTKQRMLKKFDTRAANLLEKITESGSKQFQEIQKSGVAQKIIPPLPIKSNKTFSLHNLFFSENENNNYNNYSNYNHDMDSGIQQSEEYNYNNDQSYDNNNNADTNNSINNDNLIYDRTNPSNTTRGRDSSLTYSDNDYNGPDSPELGGLSILDDANFQQWKLKSGVNFQKEELENKRRQSKSFDDTNVINLNNSNPRVSLNRQNSYNNNNNNNSNNNSNRNSFTIESSSIHSDFSHTTNQSHRLFQSNNTNNTNQNNDNTFFNNSNHSKENESIIRTQSKTHRPSFTTTNSIRMDNENQNINYNNIINNNNNSNNRDDDQGSVVSNPLLANTTFIPGVVQQLITDDQREQINRIAQDGIERAKLAGKEGWEQTKLAG
eukprot:gene6986-9547_t